MTRLAFALATLAIFARISTAETWINVGEEPMRLRRTTSCAKAAKKDRVAACDCCVIQEVRVNEYSAAEAFDRCTSSQQCDYPEGATYDLSVAANELKNSEARLSALTVINVDKLKNPPKLPDDGVLSNDDVANIIHALNHRASLDLPEALFVPQEDKTIGLKVKPLGEKAKGLYTGQLFFVGYDPSVLGTKEDEGEEQKTKPLYILKETKKGVSEIDHLYQVQASRLRHEKISTHDLHFGTANAGSATIAKIAFDDMHFKLKTNGTTRYFSLLQTAPGKSLNKHLREFGKLAAVSETDDEEFQIALKRMKHIFYRIGFAMSELHQKYADPSDTKHTIMKRTFTHGDMHSENVFWDDATDTVTLIDNETFALSLKRTSLGVNDIVEFYMLHTMHTLAHTVSTQLTTNTEFGINDALWHELWRTLFDGYLSAYGDLSKEQYVALFRDFRSEFFQELGQFRILRSPRNFMDQRKLKRFGPTIRRSKIKQHELTDAFNRLQQKSMKRFESSEGTQS